MPVSRNAVAAGCFLALGAVGWPALPQAQVLDPPELKKLEACLRPIQATMAIWKSVYGAAPATSLPTETLTKRITALTGVLTADHPATPPSPMRLRDDYSVLEREALRRELSALAIEVDAHGYHAAITRRVVERAVDMGSAGERLRGRLGPIATAPAEPAKFPDARDVVAIEVEACKAVGMGAPRLAPFVENFAFYPEWLRVTDGALTSLGRIVPSGLNVCEKPAAELAPCVAGDIVDWRGACWSRTTTLPMRDQAGTGCDNDFDALLSPYFARRAPASTPKPGPPAVRPTLRDFLAALQSLGTAATEAKGRFTAARVAHLSEFGPGLKRLRAAFEMERAALDAEGARIAAEAVEVEALRVKVATETAAVDAAGRRLGQARVTLDQDRDRVRALADQLTRLRRESESTRDAIGAADARRAAIRPECQGKPYAACTDEGAKRRFDEAVFKATEEIVRLRAEWQDQLTRSRELADERLGLQEGIASLVERISLDQRALVDSRFALQADREELERRSRTLVADIAVYEAQWAGHAADLALVSKAEAEVDRPTP